jgi:hypothetical protein
MDVSSLLSRLSQGTQARAARRDETPQVTEAGNIDPTNPPAIDAAAAIYHGADDPAAESLLAQSGVDIYLQVLNISEINEKYEKSVDLLTFGLGQTSMSLIEAYSAAVFQLSPELQQKDWGFSVANGKLVFKAGDDELSKQDIADLRKAFDSTRVKDAANAVADTVVEAIELKREASTSSENLGWGRFKVDQENFGEIVDLRDYLTAIMPGGKYNMHARDTINYGGLLKFTGWRAMVDQLIVNADELPSK